jgi:tetratricopeptide (TPR) repeat protein
MAEGLLGSTLLAEEEQRTASADVGAEAFAAAVAANLSNQNPEVAAETVTFLRKQTELLEAQRKTVETEHEFFEVEWGPRLLGIRLRIAFQVFAAIAATVIGVGVVVMIYDAVESHNVVIDAFDISPNVSAEVPSGKIVAAGAVHMGKQLKSLAGGRPGRAAEAFYANFDQLVWDLPTEHAGLVADMKSNGGSGTLGSPSGSDNLEVAGIEVLMHSDEAAALRLTTTLVDERNGSDVAFAAFDRALLAEEHADLQAAARDWDAFAAAYANPTVQTNSPQSICFAAITYEKTGQSAKADAALNAVGKLTFVDCYRFRADLFDLRGDWAGAEEWYAKTILLGPSIPSGYNSWGMALAKHGDLDGAIAKFKDANQKGPHWADPLKAWGDVLVKQAKTKKAIEKYDEALKYAPDWKELKQAREGLVAKL